MNVRRGEDLARFFDCTIGGERLLDEGFNAFLTSCLALDGLQHDAMGGTPRLAGDAGDTNPKFPGQFERRSLGHG